MYRSNLFFEKPKNLKNYLAEISPGSENSANVIIDISELNSYFKIDLTSKNKDTATNFKTLSELFKNAHDIQFIHHKAIRIDRVCLNELIDNIRAHQANVEKFNHRLNVFLVAHGGPAWFFGPIQDYLNEKIGMVWLNYMSINQQPFFPYSHFVLTPSQLYFFPKQQVQAINCQLSKDDIQVFIEIFNPENLKPKHTNARGIQMVASLSRSEINAILDWITFDIEFSDEESIAWIHKEGFNKKHPALINKKHFVMSNKSLFFYNGESYIELKHANLETLKNKLPKTNTLTFQHSNTTYHGYLNLSKSLRNTIKTHLHQAGITYSQVNFRQKDFIFDEAQGANLVKFILNQITLLTKVTIDNVILHSCFSASEFYNERNQNYMFSSARMFSTLVKDINVIGCVGINADIKVPKLYLQKDLDNENLAPCPMNYNLTDTLITYRNGTSVKNPSYQFAVKNEGAFFRYLNNVLFKNQNNSFFYLHYLDSFYEKLLSEKNEDSFGADQVNIFKSLNNS